MTNPITALTPSKSTVNYGLKIFGWIIIFLLLVWALWYFFIRVKFNKSKVKQLISEASKKYVGNEANVEKLLMAGVEQIAYDRELSKQAKVFADSTGVPIEQVLVDNAVAMAKQFEYIQ